jgi:hypothetical protein
MNTDEEGWSEFNAWLLKYPNMLISILVDTVDEDYRQEWLPHTWGGTRKEMVTRKLRQMYFNTPYRAAQHLERSSEKRRDDAWLFMSITSGEILRPWLEVIGMRLAPLAGIYLLPLASQFLLTRFEPRPADDILFVSRQSAGLRLSYFKQGQLRFSRLAGLEYYNDPLAGCAAEIAKTRQFLINQRWLRREARLSILALDVSEQFQGLQHQFSNDEQLTCRRLQRKEIARLSGLPEQLMSEHPEIVHLEALLGKSPISNFAPESMLRGYHVHRAGGIIHGMSAAAFAVMVGLSIWNLMQEQTLREDSDRLRHNLVDEEKHVQALRASLQATPVAPEKLQSRVELVQRLLQARRLPAAAWDVLSKSLAAQSHIVLSELSWRHGKQDEKNTTPIFSADTEQIGLQASVTGIADRAQKRLAILNFKQHLERQPGIEQVNITRWPAELDPSMPLAGQSGMDLQSQNETFEMQAGYRGAP